MIKKLLKEKMNEGFSLLELVMVMVILGILSAVAIPKMTITITNSTNEKPSFILCFSFFIIVLANQAYTRPELAGKEDWNIQCLR